MADVTGTNGCPPTICFIKRAWSFVSLDPDSRIIAFLGIPKNLATSAIVWASGTGSKAPHPDRMSLLPGFSRNTRIPSMSRMSGWQYNLPLMGIEGSELCPRQAPQHISPFPPSYRPQTCNPEALFRDLEIGP